MADDFERYACQMALPAFGPDAQKLLQQTRVLIVGMGGLGCPVAAYLTAAGVGVIGLADDDVITLSNLHRQILFTPEDLGKAKVAVAAKRLQAQNPSVQILPHNLRVTSDNVMELIAPFDLIIEGTDNFETKYLLNDACVLSGKPLLYGAIYQYEGQVGLWNVRRPDGSYSPNYRDVFPDAENAEVPNCHDGGVLPTLAGMVGCMQASEAIKLLTGTGTPMTGKLWMINLLEGTTRIVQLKPQSAVKITVLPPTIATMSWETLQEQHKQEPYILVDVREREEHQLFNIGGINLPLEELKQSPETLPFSGTGFIVCYCSSGKRSAAAVRFLQGRFPGAGIYSLKGGIEKIRD